MASGFVLASVFVVGVSSWFLLKKRDTLFAKRSIVIASVFGITTSLFLIWSGDESARQMADKQPMKFAAMEALWDGQANAPPLVVIGLLQKPTPPKTEGNLRRWNLRLRSKFLAYFLI